MTLILADSRAINAIKENQAEAISNFAANQVKLESLLLNLDEYHASQNKTVL